MLPAAWALRSLESLMERRAELQADLALRHGTPRISPHQERASCTASSERNLAKVRGGEWGRARKEGPPYVRGSVSEWHRACNAAADGPLVRQRPTPKPKFQGSACIACSLLLHTSAKYAHAQCRYCACTPLKEGNAHSP
jgi:hypothetical protein